MTDPGEPTFGTLLSGARAMYPQAYLALVPAVRPDALPTDPRPPALAVRWDAPARLHPEQRLHLVMPDDWTERLADMVAFTSAPTPYVLLKGGDRCFLVTPSGPRPRAPPPREPPQLQPQPPSQREQQEPALSADAAGPRHRPDTSQAGWARLNMTAELAAVHYERLASELTKRLGGGLRCTADFALRTLQVHQPGPPREHVGWKGLCFQPAPVTGSVGDTHAYMMKPEAVEGAPRWTATELMALATAVAAALPCVPPRAAKDASPLAE